jgi:hypothetical protein
MQCMHPCACADVFAHAQGERVARRVVTAQRGVGRCACGTPTNSHSHSQQRAIPPTLTPPLPPLRATAKHANGRTLAMVWAFLAQERVFAQPHYSPPYFSKTVQLFLFFMAFKICSATSPQACEAICQACSPMGVRVYTLRSRPETT